MKINGITPKKINGINVEESVYEQDFSGGSVPSEWSCDNGSNYIRVVSSYGGRSNVLEMDDKNWGTHKHYGIIGDLLQAFYYVSFYFYPQTDSDEWSRVFFVNETPAYKLPSFQWLDYWEGYSNDLIVDGVNVNSNFSKKWYFCEMFLDIVNQKYIWIKVDNETELTDDDLYNLSENFTGIRFKIQGGWNQAGSHHLDDICVKKIRKFNGEPIIA